MTTPETIAPSDIQDFAARFSTANQLAQTRLQKILYGFGFTQTQLNVLAAISAQPSDQPALKVGELAKAVDITQPAATKIVAKFESQDLIAFAQESQDKRHKQVRITQKGRDQTHKMQMALYPDMQTWFADWNRDHLLAFTALLHRLGDRLSDK